MVLSQKTEFLEKIIPQNMGGVCEANSKLKTAIDSSPYMQWSFAPLGGVCEANSKLKTARDSSPYMQ